VEKIAKCPAGCRLLFMLFAC